MLELKEDRDTLKHEAHAMRRDLKLLSSERDHLGLRVKRLEAALAKAMEATRRALDNKHNRREPPAGVPPIDVLALPATLQVTNADVLSHIPESPGIVATATAATTSMLPEGMPPGLPSGFPPPV